MTWDAFHSRGDVLRTLVAEANRRRDGALPMELPGVAETFGDELSLIAALQLRWHTRLAGRIERALMEQPTDLESAVLQAWRSTASELVGVREILDACTARPTTPEMGAALATAHGKEMVLMAAMAGRASGPGPRAVRVGEQLEAKARVAYHPQTAPQPRPENERSTTLLGRLKAHLAA